MAPGWVTQNSVWLRRGGDAKSFLFASSPSDVTSVSADIIFNCQTDMARGPTRIRKIGTLHSEGISSELRVGAKADDLSGGKTPIVKLARLADMDPDLERNSP